MTSDRPYRDAMPSRVARLRLAQAVGTQFDTSVVAAFEAILAMAPESYRLADCADFHHVRTDSVDQDWTAHPVHAIDLPGSVVVLEAGTG
jgi:HD-GYP domain-containing protein (c-di-GMP phosphodiesterase class II)